MALAVLVGTVAAIRATRARRRARRRIVESPNSHYTSQLVRERETQHRWQNIRLDEIHEVNRGEVVRLLARVEAAGVQSLRENERRFLDYIERIAGSGG